MPSEQSASSITHSVTCPNCKKETYEFERECHICGHDRWEDRDSEPERTIINLTKTCDYCPSQWEGQLADGRHVYIRCRMENFSVGVGETFQDAASAQNKVLSVQGVDLYATKDMRAFLRDRGWAFDVEHRPAAIESSGVLD